MRMNRRDRAVAWVSGGLLLAIAVLLALDSLLGLGILQAVSAWLAGTDIWRRIILVALAVAAIGLAVMLIWQPKRVSKQQPPAVMQQFGEDQGAITMETVDQLLRKREADAKAEQIIYEQESKAAIERLTRERDAEKARVKMLEAEVERQRLMAEAEAERQRQAAVAAQQPPEEQPCEAAAETSEPEEEPPTEKQMTEPEKPEEPEIIETPEEPAPIKEEPEPEDQPESEELEIIESPEEPALIEKEPESEEQPELDKEPLAGPEPVPLTKEPEPNDDVPIIKEPETEEAHSVEPEIEKPAKEDGIDQDTIDPMIDDIQPEEAPPIVCKWHFNRRAAMKQRRRMRQLWDRTHGGEDGGTIDG